ncbi:MAG TPA: amidohydrolase family protein [Candidatus Binataceae bacterium]|nr:amidohydrolase family protein [Candidatus Binataceae bacterium]
MRIDVHAHYYPNTMIKRAERLGADLSAVRRISLASEEKADLEARLKMMDEAGVDMQALSVSSTQPYYEKENDAVDAARESNDLYAELVERHPKRFAAFAALPLPHVDAAMKELERALDQLKMVGVTIGTSVVSRSAAEEAFEPVYAEMNRRGCALFVHPAGLGVCSPLIRDFGLTWVCGAPFEDTMFALHIIRRQIPQRYPKIKIIVPHLGGAIPALFTRLDATKPMYAAPNAEPPTTTLKRLWYDTVAQNNTAGLKCAVATLGADRLVYGSDYPYQLHAEYLNSVKYVQESGLPKADIDKMLDQTAARLLGIAG